MNDRESKTSAPADASGVRYYSTRDPRGAEEAGRPTGSRGGSRHKHVTRLGASGSNPNSLLQVLLPYVIDSRQTKNST